jgi:acetyl esterase/lipase
MLLILATIGTAHAQSGRAEEVMRLWSGDAPGAPPLATPETSRRQRSGENEITVVQHVSVPTFTVVRPAPGTANGTAMLVLPGGAFMALAWDLEGMEVARWLADRGITAFVLKYRVSELKLAPGAARPDFAELVRLIQPKRKLAVADAGQAVALIRRDAAKYGVDPKRIGMMGFSAGAVTTLGLVFEGAPAQRPDFAAPIYGMPMIPNPVVPAGAPPMFLVHAQDDPTVPAEGSTQVFELWSKAKRPAELHIYAAGGHGFGMRPKGRPVDHWPAAFDAWLRSQGYLQPQAAR